MRDGGGRGARWSRRSVLDLLHANVSAAMANGYESVQFTMPPRPLVRSNRYRQAGEQFLSEIDRVAERHGYSLVLAEAGRLSRHHRRRHHRIYQRRPSDNGGAGVRVPRLPRPSVPTRATYRERLPTWRRDAGHDQPP